MISAVQTPLLPEGEETRALPPAQLAKFEGPLDVLLHLIRSQELDVFDIPLAMITQQYLDILEAQEQLDLEIAGDYLVMASTLMQLKSRMLLPRPEVDDEGNQVDPRAELRSEEHTSELQSHHDLVCRLLLEKKKTKTKKKTKNKSTSVARAQRD